MMRAFPDVMKVLTLPFSHVTLTNGYLYNDILFYCVAQQGINYFSIRRWDLQKSR